MTRRPKKLLVQVRDATRLKHHAYSTENPYVYWDILVFPPAAGAWPVA